MDDKVKAYYDQNAEGEWGRLDRNPHEFELTKRMISRYIKPGDTVLDIGGGPGRYSLWLAELGCEVTLLDLAPENVKFAQSKAAERGLKIKAIAGNALEADKLVIGKFDHVLIMGPMYHLLEEGDRVAAMNAALSLLKPGGNVYVSFITLLSNALNGLMDSPGLICDGSKSDMEYFEKLIANESWAYPGDYGFTAAYFIRPSEIPEFMSRFPLEQKHLFAQEGILVRSNQMLLEQPEMITSKWYDLAEKLCERPEYLGYSEHAMYIGQKAETQL